MSYNQKKLSAPLRITILDSSNRVFEKDFSHFPIIIGRSQKNEVPLSQYDFISRQHAAITEDENGLYIVDLNSANGFSVNGKRVTKFEIKELFEARIGVLKVQIRFLTDTQANADATILTHEPVPQNPKVDTEATQKQISHVKPPVPPVALLSDDDRTPPPDTQQAVKLGQVKPIAPAVPPPVQVSPVLSSDAEKKRSEVIDAQTVVAIRQPETMIRLQKFGEKPAVRGHEHRPAGTLDSMLIPHPLASRLKPNQRVLEGVVTWHDEIYDIQQFRLGEKVSVGSGYGVGLNLPTLKHPIDFAVHEPKNTRCFVPQGATVEVQQPNRVISMTELMSSQALVKRGTGYILKVGNEDLVTVDLDGQTKLHFRYAPAPRQLSKKRIVEPDEEFKKSSLVSGLFHFFIAALAALNAPPSHGPKLNGVPDRVARLIVEPPRVLIPEPEKKIEQIKKKIEIIKREKIKQEIVKKIQPKPKRVVMPEIPKKLPVKENANAQVKGPPVKMKNPEVNVQTLGALAALSALPASTPSEVPASININKDAGGKRGPATNGLISNLSTASGKLGAASGMGTNVKIKGAGYGTGTGYGTQGMSGKAGQRGIAGAVVGTPKLLSTKSEQGLTQAQVMAEVKKHLGEIQNCYERTLLTTPGLAGRVEYEWDISPKGLVGDVRVKKSEMSGADALNSCVFGVFKKMKFPVAKNGQATVPNIGFPFGRL